MTSISFGTYLSDLRAQARLTVRELATKAGVPHSLVAGLQSGKRRTGEIQARKIGTALGLRGFELEQFILQAIDTSSEKVLSSVKEYPAGLLNFLAVHLSKKGISPESLVDCRWEPDSEGDRLSLRLASGSKVSISTVLTYV